MRSVSLYFSMGYAYIHAYMRTTLARLGRAWWPYFDSWWDSFQECSAWMDMWRNVLKIALTAANLITNSSTFVSEKLLSI